MTTKSPQDALTGKVAVITGASSGIGLAVANELAGRGVRLVLGARSSDRLSTVADTIKGEVLAVRTDVTIARDVSRLFHEAAERFGQIDIVVANAGIYVGGDVASGAPEDFDSLIDTNVKGVMRTVHAALGYMMPRSSGDIIITSSVSGHQAISWEPVYSASKHALQAFAHGLRRQLVTSGIRVGAIAPGVVLNDLWAISDPGAINAGVAAATGLRSEDVADGIVFMLTRPPHVNIRDLVILPTNQEI